MTNNTSEADLARHMKIITEVELQEIMDTGRESVENTRFMYDIITHDKTEYFSPALSEVVNGENGHYWILVHEIQDW